MKKALLTVLISLILIIPSFAIGFGYHVLDIRTSPNFSIGGHWELPVSVVYQFNFPVPDFIKGSTTSLAFRLDNGLDYRTLRQDPLTGAILSDDDERFPARDYMTLFDEFNLEFAQGMIHTGFADEDLLTLKVSIDGRFENAYESLDYFSDKDHREGLFHTIENGAIADRSPFGSDFLPGTPELSADRSVFQLSLSAGLDINFMKDDVTSINGIKLSSFARWSPSWLQLFSDTSDFLLWENRLDLAWTMFRLPFVNGLSSLSMMLSDSVEYRYLTGEKVPYYAMGTEVWETRGYPTEHVITNHLALTLFGPQLFFRDVYPYVSAFFDLTYSWGRILNSDGLRMEGDFTASYGVKAELVLFNVSTVFYELGVVSPSSNPDDIYSIQRFGFKVGL